MFASHGLPWHRIVCSIHQSNSSSVCPFHANTGTPDSAIAAATNPLKPGESGSTTFIAGAPGTYHYICTVPGHALQGMIGEFIVE